MKKQGKTLQHVIYWVRIPLKFTYRSLPGLYIVETHSRDLEVPILSWHLKEIERLIRETHASAEQALTSLIQAHLEEKRAISQGRTRVPPDYDQWGTDLQQRAAGTPETVKHASFLLSQKRPFLRHTLGSSICRGGTIQRN
jgi:hypothetical protein